MNVRKSLLLGVTGGVAAYKAADIARRLMELRLDVTVMMTAHAEQFITPLTFEALTGNRVIRADLPAPGEEPMPHITMTRRAELILVAPATANIIGKYNSGVADDTLSTTLLATNRPVIMAPAMNTQMWRDRSVQENVATLRERGVIFVDPATGELACGEEGEGKLAPAEEIVAAVGSVINARNDLTGRRFLVTTGGTHEAIDPVRYIGNRSSGKMGLAMATAAWRRGAEVKLIAAHCEVGLPDEIETLRVESAGEMLTAIEKEFAWCDTLLMAAAVGDYHVVERAESKVEKREEWRLTLRPNADILATIAPRKEGRTLVGFAAETGSGRERAREKRRAKGLDMIILNDVSRSDIGFGADNNEVTLITHGGEVEILKADKESVANGILDSLVTGEDKE